MLRSGTGGGRSALVDAVQSTTNDTKDARQYEMESLGHLHLPLCFFQSAFVPTLANYNTHHSTKM